VRALLSRESRRESPTSTSFPTHLVITPPRPSGMDPQGRGGQDQGQDVSHQRDEPARAPLRLPGGARSPSPPRAWRSLLSSTLGYFDQASDHAFLRLGKDGYFNKLPIYQELWESCKGKVAEERIAAAGMPSTPPAGQMALILASFDIQPRQSPSSRRRRRR